MQLSQSSYYQLAPGSTYGRTDIGTSHKSNEDNFLIDTEIGLLVIGDGMGGHDGGEIASANTLLGIRDFLRDHQGTPELVSTSDQDATWSDQIRPTVMVLYDAVASVNTSLYEKNQARHYADGRGMGTTLTGLWHEPAQHSLIAFHVGDSRLYRYRNGDLCVLTRDHTLYQQAIEEGQIDNVPARNLLLQAVGPTQSVKPDIHSHLYNSGDLFLLCTDGLYGAAPHEILKQILQRTSLNGLEQTCADLISAAKEYGSTDNITALILQCK